MRIKKPPTLAYTLLTRETHASLYDRLSRLVEQFHPELRDATIALAWCTSWKPDVDGYCPLGKCKRASDLDRELAPFDFVILLLESFWTSLGVTDEQRDALLDHELCHATVKLDRRTGDPVIDARGRTVYRLRKHDIEEFACIAERHGMWKRNLELFAQAMRRHTGQAALPLDEPTRLEVTMRSTH